MHQPLCLVIRPIIIAMIVVNMHIVTKTKPKAIGFPLVRIIRKISKVINKTNTNQRNQGLTKIFGMGRLALNFDNTISKKAPRGHKFQHQYRPLKKDSVKKKTAMAITKYPMNG